MPEARSTCHQPRVGLLPGLFITVISLPLFGWLAVGLMLR